MRNSRAPWACCALALTLALPCSASAQRPPETRLTATDSALIAAILVAEERRDSTAPALAAAKQHVTARMRLLALRAAARIVDPTFAARDSLGRPGALSFPVWPEPEWKARYRALAAPGGACEPLVGALGDGIAAVQLRAMDLAGARAACATHAPLLAALQRAVDAYSTDAAPSGTRPRRPDLRASHGLVALARLAPDSARPRIARLATDEQPLVRRAAARAAAIVGDSVTLRALARDTDGNVLEAVLSGLTRVTGHADDSIALRLLDAAPPQVALAAATTLKESTHPDLASRATAALATYVRRASDSERDVRLALLSLLGQPAEDPHPVRAAARLPAAATALAMGVPRYLEVTMAVGERTGRFVVELRGDIAPIMAARILEHARSGGYDGQRWHRVEWDFVVQGGSPADNEYAGAPRYLVDELSAVPHPRGSIGMSTRGHDTGDAQWFVNLRDNPRLMRDYTVFGVVVAGMDVVDAILEGDEIVSIREVSAPTRRGPP